MSFATKALDHRLLPSAAAALACAFQTDPLYNFVVPDANERRRWLPIMMREILRTTFPLAHTLVAADESSTVRAALAITPPGRHPHTWWAETRMFWNLLLLPRPWCPNLPKLWPIRRYAETFHEIHYRPPHWYVDIIGVHPASQGQGVGRQLMRQLIGLSEAGGQPIWLETQTESNIGFYESLGFRVTIQRHPAPGGPPTWGMLRECGATGA